ncbi:hypothetical protein P7C73_g360, partial [Tremellales sp. Uapishka_1]
MPSDGSPILTALSTHPLEAGSFSSYPSTTEPITPTTPDALTSLLLCASPVCSSLTSLAPSLDAVEHTEVVCHPPVFEPYGFRDKPRRPVSPGSNWFMRDLYAWDIHTEMVRLSGVRHLQDPAILEKYRTAVEYQIKYEDDLYRDLKARGHPMDDLPAMTADEQQAMRVRAWWAAQDHMLGAKAPYVTPADFATHNNDEIERQFMSFFFEEKKYARDALHGGKDHQCSPGCESASAAMKLRGRVAAWRRKSLPSPPTKKLSLEIHFLAIRTSSFSIPLPIPVAVKNANPKELGFLETLLAIRKERKKEDKRRK